MIAGDSVPALLDAQRDVISRNGIFRTNHEIVNYHEISFESFHKRNRALEEMQMIQVKSDYDH